jgi:hypothetical protein
MQSDTSDRERPSDGASWQQTLCTFQVGPERHLLGEVRSKEEIFVVTMCPPALRDVVKISLPSESENGSACVEALVTDVSYHHTEVTRCGFTAMILDPSVTFAYPPVASLQNVDVSASALSREERIEKRRDPRIRTRILAVVHIPGHDLSARILNLSMSGALIGFDREQFPPEITLGTLLRVDMYDEHGDVFLAAKCEAIRLIGVGRPTNAGARFIDVDDEVKSRLEQLILREITAQRRANPDEVRS